MKDSPNLDMSRLLLFAANRAIYEHVSVEVGFCNNTDSSAIQSQFIVEVTDISERRVVFCFPSAQPDMYSITDICFHDDGLLGTATVMGCLTGCDVELPHDGFMESNNTNHGDSETRHINLGRSSKLPVDADPVRYTNIHGPHDFWVIIFDLQSGAGFADIMYALNKGRLRINIKVKDLKSGHCELLTNEPILTLGQTSRPQQPVSFPLSKTA